MATTNIWNGEFLPWQIQINEIGSYAVSIQEYISYELELICITRKDHSVKQHCKYKSWRKWINTWAQTCSNTGVTSVLHLAIDSFFFVVVSKLMFSCDPCQSCCNDLSHMQKCICTYLSHMEEGICTHLTETWQKYSLRDVPADQRRHLTHKL